MPCQLAHDDDHMKPWLWFLLAIAASAISWSYSHRILIPWDYNVNLQRIGLQTDMGDLYPRWVGTREVWLEHRNPYSEYVSHEIQMGFYGHPIEQSFDKPPGATTPPIIDEQRFAYPVYVVLLLAPTVHLNFAALQIWAPVILASLTAISAWIWLAIIRWKPPALVMAALAVFVLSSPQLAQGLRLRQLGLFVAFLLTMASWCVIRRHYFAAGVLLAVATIKPQMVLLCVIWFLLWTLGEWKKRWPVAAGFGVTLAALIGAGELLVHGWPRDFLAGLEAYRKYFPTTSPLRLLLGNWIGGAVSVLVLVALLFYAWKCRHADADSAEFIRLLALFFIATTLVLPLLAPYNQVLLLLPVAVLLRDWQSLSKAGRLAFGALVAWPPVAAMALLVYPPQIHSLSLWPLLPSAMVLFFLFLVSFLFIRHPLPD